MTVAATIGREWEDKGGKYLENCGQCVKEVIKVINLFMNSHDYYD
jgi:hypothetical protein